jgi:IS5 family transposase
MLMHRSFPFPCSTSRRKIVKRSIVAKTQSAIKAQRDIDAAWTRKHNKSYFGYKNHIKVDSRTKLIRTFEVTPANMHDSPRWVSCSAASKIKVRARVEHTFGAMRMKVGDVRIRSIGEIRTTFVIGMRNLLYNICRVDSIKRIPVEMG